MPSTIVAQDIEVKHPGGHDHSSAPFRGNRLEINQDTPSVPTNSLLSQSRSATYKLNSENQLRILLVEDHLDTAQVLSRLLSLAGYQVTTVYTAHDAIAAAKNAQFDVLVSDIGLPDANGYELMREIRELYPVSGVALSGYGMEEDMRRSREAGFSDHIVKPVNFVQLKQSIERIMPR